MGIKDLLLNKGWAGRTIDREATIDRVNPLIRTLTELMHLYDHTLDRVNGAGRATVETSQRTLRADIGKLCETVFSAGGIAYSGTDIEPGDLTLGDEFLVELARREEHFLEAVDAESEVEHQMRTRAVLAAVRANGAGRLSMIRSLSGR